MQIQIGEKIRELRRRDGRTQENLAEALGVTGQAVSRWEAGIGYPDMELVPAIANYFHVTIDRLFGYHGDREEKIQAILDRTEQAIVTQTHLSECVEMLKAAAEEFPGEPKILLNLGYALEQLGWQKHGARSYTEDGSDYAKEDVAYNAQNRYWQEEVRVFEKLLGMDLPKEDREAVVLLTVGVCARMGMYEKAEELADRQDSLRISRECLLPLAKREEDRDASLGEAIIALLGELEKVMVNAVTAKVSLALSEAAIDKFAALIGLYRAVFDDGNCGIAHTHLRDLYLLCAIIRARQGESEAAMEDFDLAFTHSQRYKAVCHPGEYAYTAPLVAKVTFPGANFPTIPDDFWKGWIPVFPKEFQDKLRENAKYAECFA